MNTKHLAVLFWITICSCGSTVAAEYVAKRDTMGATDKAEPKKALEYAVDNDTQATVQAMMRGKIFPVAKGTKLFSTSYSLFDASYIQVREKGSTKRFWVMTDFIEKIHETPAEEKSVEPTPTPTAEISQSPKEAGKEWGKSEAKRSVAVKKNKPEKGTIPSMNREKLLKYVLKEAAKRYSEPDPQGEFAAAANGSFLAEYQRVKPKRWK